LAGDRPVVAEECDRGSATSEPEAITEDPATTFGAMAGDPGRPEATTRPPACALRIERIASGLNACAMGGIPRCGRGGSLHDRAGPLGEDLRLVSVGVGALVPLFWLAAAPGEDPRSYAGPRAAPEAAESTHRPGDTGPPKEPTASGTAEASSPAPAPPRAEEPEVREITVGTPRPAASERNRATSVVDRRELDERLPRSAPDALRYEPGVYIQQTAHGQASPYVRGLTGQQTVMFFDGVRLNNSTFRQGPNQYFFTIDSRTIDSLEVLRGSASTRYGSDALGGVLLSRPIEPEVSEKRGVVAHGRAGLQTATADAQVGGRGQLELSLGPKVAILGGVGYRDVGQLRSGGRIRQPGTGAPQTVPPVFEADGKTQRGTGFSELTADTRLVFQPRREHRFTVAYYDYRQYDVPRTDRCPPPTAPQDECLTYHEQFRTMVYGAYDRTKGPAAAEWFRMTLSYQRQHEDRELDRGSPSVTRLTGVDDVDSVGSSMRVETRRFALGPWATLGVDYGGDVYYDSIGSTGAIVFDDAMISTDLSRGQYLDGAQYVTSGTWSDLRLELADAVRWRGGGRVGVVAARAQGDPSSESADVDATWTSVVGGTGLAVDAVPWLTLAGNLDQGFRAPNLDDLTSRQQTGPGFQFENADLRPERSLSIDGGLQVRARWIELDAWVFRTTIRDLIDRVARTAEECPMNDPGCGASQTRFQLDNFAGRAVLWGAEGSLRFYLPLGFWSRATISFARGDRPNPFAGPSDRATVPISRIPPLHGTGELGWRSSFGLYTAAAVRWARLQSRLAPQDVADARIPIGGTPGYAVVDLRAGFRLEPHVLLALVFENVGDAAWRAHGSSVNGPGRGLLLDLQFGF
jgi:outer membrane receptor protein involved in Fe transport